ncbi:MAG: hypothetical protein AB7P22_00745 [Vicinamibacterales bacterium]
MDLLVESDAAGYLKFTRCEIIDPASGNPCELNDVQKHAMVKYLGGSYDWELHWQRAPESLKKVFAHSTTAQPCGDQHDWDGCICRRCGVTRPHEWGAVEEHDYSGLSVFDSRGTVKRVLARTCVHCQKEETVRTEYQ